MHLALPFLFEFLLSDQDMPNEHITVDTLAFAPATRELIEPVLECVNDAFIADAFFKKPAYVNRMSLAGTFVFRLV